MSKGSVMISDNTTLAFLLTHEFNQAFYAWDAALPPRDGLHASSVLESDADFCVRQHVLADSFLDERQQKEQYLSALQKFLHGWQIHEKWQYKLLKSTGLVLWNHSMGEYELDLTHIDPESDIKYSPDAIIEYAGFVMPVEIKGINHEDYAGQQELYRRVPPDHVGTSMANLLGTYEKAHDKRPGIVGATLQEAMGRNKSIRSAYPQVQLYMHLLGLQKGVILVENKNTQDFILWIVDYDASVVTKPLARAKDVKEANQEYYDLGILPERICATRNDARAKRCPFRDACFNRANGGGGE